MAFRARAAILLAMDEGQVALSDLKLAASFGLDTQKNVDYYIQLAKAYERRYFFFVNKLTYLFVVSFLNSYG